MPKDTQGKVVLITGAAAGRGKGLRPKEFASLGAKVVVTTGHGARQRRSRGTGNSGCRWRSHVFALRYLQRRERKDLH